MNKKTMTILGIVLTTVVLVVGLFWHLDNKRVKEFRENSRIKLEQARKESLKEEFKNILYNEDGSINTTNWETYKDEKIGFEVKYPKNWKYTVETGSNEVKPDLIGSVSFENKKCEINYYAQGMNPYEKPESCNKIIRIEYYNKDSHFSSNPLQNKRVCNIGQIPLLNFKHEFSDIVACQTFGIATAVWHKYMINSEMADFMLVIRYIDEEIEPRDYNWNTNVEKNQYYTYDNSERFDLRLHREILKSFKITEK